MSFQSFSGEVASPGIRHPMPMIAIGVGFSMLAGLIARSLQVGKSMEARKGSTSQLGLMENLRVILYESHDKGNISKVR